LGRKAETLDGLLLDTTGWTTHSSTELDRNWFDENRNPIRARLLDAPSPETTIEGWRKRGAQETGASGGVVLSFDEVRLDGCLAFRGLFKFPATRCIPDWPEKSLAVYIVGMIVVPLGARSLMINTEAVERGTTGAREAVYGVLQTRPTSSSAPGAPAKVGTMEDFFDRVRQTTAMVLRSDAEEFDALVELHPLSCVRRRQRWVLEHARLAPELKRSALRQ
jgi:hypothetical protein